MTFSELRTLIRNEIIVDQYDDAFIDGDIDDTLWRASFEIAAALDLPRATTTAAVTAGDTSFSAPADCARIHSIMLDGDDAAPADAHKVLRMQSGSNRAIRYFNFDPRRGGDILIAPPSVGGTATVIYTQLLTRPADVDFDSEEPWNGVLPQFHPIIVYRAGVALFQMEEREDEAEPWRVEYNNRAQEMAAFLGVTDMATLLIEAQMRNDMGAES